MNATRIATLALIAATAVPAHAKLKIVTTTSDLGWFTSEIGGDRVEVKVLSKGYQDPHYLEPKPSYLVDLARADALFFVGLDLEVGWLPKLLDGAHNPNIQHGRPGLFTPAGAVKALEVPTGPVDRSTGDVHPFGNPHYWLCSDNAKAVVDAIAGHLEELDSEGAKDYAARAVALVATIDAKSAEWTRTLADARGMKVITYHKTLNYFLDQFGIVGIDYIEPRPGVPPSSKHLVKLIADVKRDNVKLILVENFFEPRNGGFVADRTGVPMAVVPVSVDGEKGIDSWFAVMENLVRAVDTAAKR